MKKLFLKIKNFWVNHGPTKRRLIQLYSALLFNSYIKGYITGDIFKGLTKNVCTPGLNCYSCPGAVTSCPLGALQNSFASSNKTAPYYMLGIIMLYGMIFGRWICGWLCPFGLFQDLLHKINTPKLKKNRFTRVLSFFKYVIVALFVVILPLIYMLRDFPLPAFCKYICPAGTVGGAIGLLINPANESKFGMLGPLFTWKFILAVSIIVGSIFIYRIFCRFLCPLGALYGLFNKLSLFGIKLEKNKCINCGKCISVCKMDIHHVGDIECINCGECISSCPTKAISWKGAKIILPENELNSAKTEEEKEVIEKKRDSRVKLITRITAAVLSMILIGSLVYFNFYYDDGTDDLINEGNNNIGGSVDGGNGEDEGNDNGNDGIKVGYNVGEKCPTLDLEAINRDGIINIADFKGKTVVVNFWGTWCGPCVQELPHFNQVASDYADEVVVIAVHTDSLRNTAPGFVNKNYSDSNIIFAYDQPYTSTVDKYFTLLGGSDSWPRTLVIDAEGIITFTKDGPLSHDQLLNAVENAINKNK